jgi:hypothetical protein
MDALPDLAPISDGYAHLPVGEAFNWQNATRRLGNGEWYVVAFRSVRRAGADELRLNEYDEMAHQEAASAPGFVHYFKGPAATDGSCLSFCMWQSRTDARIASGGPAHRRAVTLLDEMYERYALEFLRVRRVAGGPLTFAPYDGPHPAQAEPLPDAPAPGFVIRPAAAT